ncbi:MAG: FMN-binding protein [Acidimicrobiales bacterium]|jgi:uncharacterized protein with FMN-binding domain
MHTMRRAPVVIGATAVGLAGVLAFHTQPARLTLGGSSGSSTVRTAPATSVAAGPPSGNGASGGTTSTSSTPSGSASSPSANRTATGAQVNYNYGILSVSVTVSGKKVTKVGIASLDDGGNFRSQSIDQQSIPILEQQALQAQSANIQGVSGASYTSAGFAQSLQSALSKLHVP